MARTIHGSRSGRKADDAPGQARSSGARAITIAPPAYGIDFVDRGLEARPPSPGAWAGTARAARTAGPLRFGPVPPAMPREAVSGVPAPLRAGVEARSGVDLSGVRVHRGSAEPARFGALAFARGDDIHLGDDRDAHLPHEVWHVVQQRQGRVEPTRHEGGVAVNDDPALEREASRMAADGPRGGRADRSAPDGRPPAVVQCLVAPPGRTVRRWDRADVKLKRIATAVDAYNATAGTERFFEDYQESFAKLQRVDRTIHAWFAAKSRVHQQLSQIPHYQQVQALLNSAATEHEALVERTKFMHVLPFDITGMTRAEITAARALWADIVGRRGDIKVLGSDAYQIRIRAELAKILSTPTGRRLLTYLNAPKPGVVLGSPAAALSKIYIGERIADLPPDVAAASPELEEQDRSEAQPLNVAEGTPGRRIADLTEATETDIDPHNPPDPRAFPAVTAANLSRVRRAVLSGGRGYTHGGKKYEFTKPGTGSFVTSFPGLSLMGGQFGGNQILDPSWVTLGHELGHSANMRAGATQKGQKSAVDAPLVTGLAGGVAANRQWTDAEELLNIRNIENALRREAGLSRRVGHQPPPWAQATAIQVRNALRAPLYVLSRQDRAWFQHPDWKRLETKYRTLPMLSCNDPAVVQACQMERDAFLQQWTVGPLAAPTGGSAAFVQWKVAQGL